MAIIRIFKERNDETTGNRQKTGDEKLSAPHRGYRNGEPRGLCPGEQPAGNHRSSHRLVPAGLVCLGGLEAQPQGNSALFNGNITGYAGYVNERLSRALKNRRVILEIENAGASEFFENRLLKITVNQEDRLVQPLNVGGLIGNEYVPADCGRVEFIPPEDFDGKMGFAFDHAILKNLKITLWYE